MPVTIPQDHRAPGEAGARSPVDPTGDDPGLDRRLRAADPLADLLPDDWSAVLVRRLAADVVSDGHQRCRRAAGAADDVKANCPPLWTRSSDR
jgi:hypothetical protein